MSIKGYDNWLTDGHDPDSVGQCENCFEELHVGEQVVLYDKSYFCDMDCFLSYVGAEETVAEKIN